MSTYRLQVHGGFPPERRRAAIVPYLERLGISTVYSSPYFTAAPGSTHGYDVCNHNEISPELGGEEAHAEFTAAVHSAGMGHIVDFVPNHMGIGSGGNAWWNDVLENGPSSRVCRRISTSTGRRSRRSCARSCCCRSWAISTATCSNAANCGSNSRTAH